MSQLFEELYDLLQDDAQLTGSSNLGHSSLVDKPLSEPYGVYQEFPADNPEPSFVLITMIGGAINNQFEDDITIGVTAFGNNYSEILQRCRILLVCTYIESADDYEHISTQFNGFGPVLFDDNVKAYYQQYTFLVKAKKK